RGRWDRTRSSRWACPRRWRRRSSPRPTWSSRWWPSCARRRARTAPGSRRVASMHELAIVEQVIEIAAASGGGARIARVVLEIGKLSAVLPDAVRFCFPLASEGTLLDGAELEIVETPG